MPTPLALVLSAIVIVGTYFTMPFWPFRKSNYDPRGKHCYITGGSSGLGKALAERLVKQGAHVTIVGRDSKKAQGVVEELKVNLKGKQRKPDLITI